MDEAATTNYVLQVEVRNPDLLLFKGQAESLTTYNAKGLFDVLPVHENFISIIKDEVIVRSSEGEKKFPLTSGVIKVEENDVKIFIGPANAS